MSQDKFQILFDRSTDPHIIFDATGITDCNDAMIRLLGASDKSRVLSLHPAALSPEFQPDGRRSAEKSDEMDRIARATGHHRFEWVHRRLDGKEVPVEVAMSAVELDSGPAMVLVWHDLTERKRAENELLRLGERLAEANGRLETVNLRMKRDLNAAAQVQQSLLPRDLPVSTGARFAWSYRPCTELAGDILNVFRLDDRNVGLYVLDVSGHGAVASLLSVAASHLISPVGDSGLLRGPHETADLGVRLSPPPEVATRLNSIFAGRPENEQYFTLLYGILNLDTPEFRYVCGGHPGPIHFPPGGPARVVESSGFPVGIFEEATFEELRLPLDRGDRLYLYSDGLPEAMGPGEEQFGQLRLLNAVQAGANETLEASVARLRAEVEAWCGESGPQDDLSILAVEIGTPA
jgi:sigma-B regulation protein RsbU (phosphoserine phosphatase)